ncbi:hypothetical protein ASG89_02760 [Paenibacillus sp. Soil766]|uniref:Ig-like domain-containing protein n=1 Tax=Paenibacillus sp. Soil766 TaxID=1736404 RepID=UPI0007090D21|nr:Ig-like domain-containing protein [Paenibacillus sp. Soil766]KRF03698.1 hypothetical protein ASG89_02760 [Paenibacillus sp. Soil766]
MVKRMLLLFLILTFIITPFGGTRATATELVMPNMLAWYKLDTPNAEDSSGNGQHAVGTSGTWIADSGVYGGALSFNGENDIVKLNESGSGTTFLKDSFTEHSASLWFKANDTVKRQVLYERGGDTAGFAIQIADNKLEAAVANTNLMQKLSTDFTDTNAWHQVHVSFDKGQFKLYLDGVLVDSLTAPYPQVSSALNAGAIGARNAVDAFGGKGGGAWFNGMIDDVRLYSVATTPVIHATGVSLNKSKLTLGVHSTYELSAALEPLFTTNRNLMWTSSDHAVVSISSVNGDKAVIEAMSSGNATITVTSEDGNFTATCDITVIPSIVALGDEGLVAWYKLDSAYKNNEDVQFAKDSSGYDNDSVKAIGTYVGNGLVNGAFSFNGTDNIIQLNKVGSDFMIGDSSTFSQFTAGLWFKANVTDHPQQVLFERGGDTAGLAIQLNANKLEAAVVNGKERHTLSTNFTDTAAWHHVTVSFDNGLFKLYLDGSLVQSDTATYLTIGASPNQAAIGARFAVDAFGGKGGGAWFNGMIDDVKLYSAAVSPIVGPVAVSGVSLNKGNETLAVGDVLELQAIIAPSYATNKTILWSSSDEAVATVTSNVYPGAAVEAVGEGIATITAQTEDGNYIASCVITVEQSAVERISLDETNLSLKVNDTHTLTGVITPSYASNQNVVWTTSNPEVVTVDGTGHIIALQVGTAVITVTTEDGGFTASSTVTVEPIHVTGVNMNHSSITLSPGMKKLLIAAVEPAEATNQKVIWSSSNKAVATVDEQGRVTAIAPGVASMSAMTEDGGFIATCEVTVNLFAIKEVGNLMTVDSGPNQGQKMTVYDGTIEQYNGYYYLMGTGTNGNVYRSKDMVHWESPYELISDDPATLPPASSADPLYSRYGASDLLFHNGVMFYAFNGTALINGDPSTMNDTPDFQHSFWDTRFDLGIDPQMFVGANGDLIYLRKVNPDEPDPNTGADKPKRAGAWVWKVQSFFNEMGNPGRSPATETVHTQPGHWGNMNFYNFEGPELAYHNGEYYMLYVGNQFYPETGLYETGVAQATNYDEITNVDKYPGKLLARNVEQLILKYNVLLPTAEHGSQPYAYTFSQPESGWAASGYDDSTWKTGEGGFGWPEVNRTKIPSVYNNSETDNSKIWGNPSGPSTMWARRTIELNQVPEKTALRYRLEGYGKVYVNGQELVSFGGQQRAYIMTEVPSAMLHVGTNVISIEISRLGGPDLTAYHLDFGLYDTKGSAIEPDIVGPSQPNVIKGPNGFETWITYKAFWNNDNGQGKDRLYFWDQEMVADGPTSEATPGLHPDAWAPTFQDRFDTADSLSQYSGLQSDVTFDETSLRIQAPSETRELLIKDAALGNFFFESNIRFDDNDFGDKGQAGITVWHKDEDNDVKVMIDRNDHQLLIPYRINGVLNTLSYELPATFQFHHDDARTADYGEQFHTLKIYKNGSKVFAQLDHYTLNDDKPVLELDAIASQGEIGLVSDGSNIRIDNVTVTEGWSEYGSYFNGWDADWTTSEKGLQSPVGGEAITVKGDPLLENEMSVNIHSDHLPDSGKSGVVLTYKDAQNYVIASTNYETHNYELSSVVNGVSTIIATAPTARETIYGHSNYEGTKQSEYEYKLRGESEISMAKMLWFSGPFDYLNQNFELPDASSSNFGFDSWSDGWVNEQFSYEDKGKGAYSIADFSERVTTDKLRLRVPSDNNRPFSFVVREEISAQNFYKTVRSKGRLYVWVNNELIFNEADPFAGQPAQMGLYTDEVQATYNSFTGFDVSGQFMEVGTQPGEEGSGDDGNNDPSDGSGQHDSGIGNEHSQGNVDGENGIKNETKQMDLNPLEEGHLELKGHLKLIVPAGAVGSKSSITVAIAGENESPPNGVQQQLSSTYVLNDTSGNRFSKKLELTLAFDSKQLKEGQQPAVYYYNETQKKWIYVGGSMNPDGTISVAINHFTKFAVFAYNDVKLKDESQPWATESINRLKGMNAISGFPDGNFHGRDSLTRAQFAKLLVSALGLELSETKTNFADNQVIPEWAKSFVQTAAEMGIITGVGSEGNARFEGDRSITRAEMAVMIGRVLEKFNAVKLEENTDLTSFQDAYQIPNWALEGMKRVVSASIMLGYEDRTLRHEDVVTREEAAVMVCRLLELLYL